jgi:glycosyltransferase involved in cell wall biosynthesis
MSRIVIGVPTYNGAERVDDLFRSIDMRTPKDTDCQLVLVDDGSPRSAKTARVAEKYKGLFNLRYIEHGRNRGIAAGWNTISRAFDCEYVVLVNDDVIVRERWLAALLTVLERSPGAGTVGLNWDAFLPEDRPALLESPDSEKRVIPREPVSKEQNPDRSTFIHHFPGRVMCAGGQLFAFRRADFDALGGFDETYISFYEESDFGTAMAAKLRKIAVQLDFPGSWHRWSATFGASPELQAGQRVQASREHYCRKWAVPQDKLGDAFSYTNPKYLGTIPEVPIEYLRPDGQIGRGVLKVDGGFEER